MELTENNIRKATRKAATIKWLESLPEDHRFVPSSPCACMYHDLLKAKFNTESVEPYFESIRVEDVCIEINNCDFASQFQQQACDFLDRHRDEERLLRDGYEAITRDEAIAIARGL